MVKVYFNNPGRYAEANPAAPQIDVAKVDVEPEEGADRKVFEISQGLCDTLLPLGRVELVGEEETTEEETTEEETTEEETTEEETTEEEPEAEPDPDSKKKKKRGRKHRDATALE